MSDASFKTQSVTTGDTLVDNESVTTSSGSVIRQRVRIGGSTGTLLAEVSPVGGLYTSEKEEIKTGSLTTASGQAIPSGVGISDTSSPLSSPSTSAVILDSVASHGSWSIQITGTWTGTIVWEVTLDNNTWVPVNGRASNNGGRLANNAISNGLWRGVYGGMQAMRVRTVGSSWTGTANITLVLGDSAAVFQNSDVVVQNEPQYFASSAGLNSAWGVCSQEVTLPTSGTEYPLLFLWNNDSSGGRVLYLAKTQKTASTATKIRRYRTGPGGTNMTRTSGGTALTINNRANQSATATAAQAWSGTGIVVANQPSYYEKVSFIGQASANNGGSIETDEQGSILVPPQTGILWAAVPLSNNAITSIEVVYWDGSSLT